MGSRENKQNKVMRTQLWDTLYNNYVLLFIQGEKGCIHYALYKESGASKSYAMIETWASAGDLETHSKSNHVKTFQANQKGNVTAVIKTFVNV